MTFNNTMIASIFYLWLPYIRIYMQWHLLFPLPKQIYLDFTVTNKSWDQCILINLPEIHKSDTLRCVISNDCTVHRQKIPHWQWYWVALSVCCCLFLVRFWTPSHCCVTVAINFNLKPVARHLLQPPVPRLQIRWGSGERPRFTMPPTLPIPLLSLARRLQQNGLDDESGGK